MSDTLPTGWARASLLEVADLIRGVTYSKADAVDTPSADVIPVLRATNIQNRKLIFDELVYVPRDLVNQRQMVRRGDIVIATSSGSIDVVGKAAQATDDTDAAFGAFCGLLRAKEGIDPRYLGLFLQTAEYRDLVSSLARGVNINNLKRSHFEQIEIPLAPFAEQKRIADKLDRLLAAVDTCKARLDTIPAILKRFRQSVLAAATSGELTEEWRVSQANTAPWLKEPFGTLVTNHDNRRVPIRSEDRKNRRGDYLYYGAFGAIDCIDDFKYDGTYLLVAEDGKNLESRERPITNIASGRFWVNNHAHVVQAKEGTSLQFLQIFLESPTLDLKSFLTGIDQVKLTRAAMDRIPVQLPSCDEQVEIVQRVKLMFSIVEKAMNQVNCAVLRIDKITHALLAKAFSGELVPEESKAEPAEAERLGSEGRRMQTSGAGEARPASRRAGSVNG